MSKDKSGRSASFPTLIPCTTPGCSATPHQLPPTVGLAVVEHGIQSEPGFVLKLPCRDCGRTNRYTYMQLLSMVPPERRPGVPHLYQHWVFVLDYYSPQENSPDNVLIGDRILARLRRSDGKWWSGSARGQSAFEPGISPGTRIEGEVHNGYRTVMFAASGEGMRGIGGGRDWIPDDSIFTIVYEADSGELQFDNTFCSNPTCEWIFKKTWSEIQEEMPPGHSKGVRLTVECPLCGWARVIDEQSFRTPPSTAHPSMPKEWLAPVDSLATVPFSVRMYTSGALTEATSSHPVFSVDARLHGDALWDVTATEWIEDGEAVRVVRLGAIHTPEDLIFAVSEAARLTDFELPTNALLEALPRLSLLDHVTAAEVRRHIEQVDDEVGGANPASGNTRRSAAHSRSPEAQRAVNFIRRAFGYAETRSEEGGDQATGRGVSRTPPRPRGGAVSPFTGRSVEVGREVTDDSILFVHRSDTASYLYMSERVRTHASTLAIRPDNLPPGELLDVLRLLLPEAEGVKVGRGGGSADFYAFAPPEN